MPAPSSILVRLTLKGRNPKNVVPIERAKCDTLEGAMDPNYCKVVFPNGSEMWFPPVPDEPEDLDFEDADE